MPKYAHYKTENQSPANVIGWYDTDSLKYSNLPETGMIEITEDQWDRHFMDPSGWVVSGGKVSEKAA